MLIKSIKEIKLIKKSSILTSKTLGILSKYIKPGINLSKLDKIAYDYILDNGGNPAFLGLYNYPNTICTSVNNEVVHGIPRNNIYLKEGDIISIDCGVLMNKYYGEHAYTFKVGNISNIKKKLLKNTLKALYLGIKECKIGNKIGNIGYIISKYINKKGFKIVKDLGGHGIGKKMHENPYISNYNNKNNGLLIKNGMVLSIEPIVNQKTSKIKLDKDKWTYLTNDNSLSAHYEHNIAIINNKVTLLSTFKYIKNNKIKINFKN
ncbi:MAG: type I methionyl aminopeptidase [Candidatus Shikimatogenerans bostrichidophilus]|nr:MAG: type I methionyl aminopeptidase [Candidatus Shikimatogenerans bostrichidophilus]